VDRVTAFHGAVSDADVGVPTATMAAAASSGDAIAPSLLPAPEGRALPDDASAALAILWVETLQQDRASARRAARSAERRIEAANHREIVERRAAARDEYRGARAAAIGGAAEGVAAVAAAGCHGTDGKTARAVLTAEGRLARDLGDVVAATSERAADEHDVTAEEARQRAAAAQRDYDQSTDEGSQAESDITRVLDLLRDLLGAERKAESAAVVRG